MHTIDLVTTVAFIAAFAAQASRLLVASRPFWSRLPAWAQTLLPVLAPTLTTLVQGLTGVHSWGDLSVQFMVCAGLLLPGLPSNRSAAPLQEGKEPKLTPSAGDLAVAEAMIAKASVEPPPPGDDDTTPPWPRDPTAPVIGLLIALLFSFHASACTPHARTSADVVQDAYTGAVVALEVADTVETAYLDSLVQPSDAQIEQAAAVVEKLKTIRAALVAVHDDIEHGREKLLAAIGDLRAAIALIRQFGGRVPEKVDAAIAVADGVLR